jgi:hypothetical protein
VILEEWPLLMDPRKEASSTGAVTPSRAQRANRSVEPAHVVEFDPDVCGSCSLRAQCTHSANGKGRTVSIASGDEHLQKKLRLRVLQATGTGRSRLRRRVGLEHRLAHTRLAKAGCARYIGVRKNVLDLRSAAAIRNLETIHRRKLAA